MELGLLLPVYWGRGPEELGLPGEPPAKGHGHPLRHPLWEEGGRTEGPAHCSGPQALRQSWRVSEAQEGGTGQPHQAPLGTAQNLVHSLCQRDTSEGHLRTVDRRGGQGSSTQACRPQSSDSDRDWEPGLEAAPPPDPKGRWVKRRLLSADGLTLCPCRSPAGLSPRDGAFQ